jgi:hypothetical protein
VRGLAKIENIHRPLQIFYLAIMHRFSNFDTGQTMLEDKDSANGLSVSAATARIEGSIQRNQ